MASPSSTPPTSTARRLPFATYQQPQQQQHQQQQQQQPQPQPTPRPLKQRLSYIRSLHEANAIAGYLLQRHMLASNSPDSPLMVVGLDSEWTVLYQRGVPLRPIALIQICTEEVCYLFHVKHMPSFPEQLRLLLETPTLIKIGASINTDLHKFVNDFGIQVQGAQEITEYARFHLGYAQRQQLSLADMMLRFFGVVLEKEIRTSDWELPELSTDQLNYAALDAACCLQLYNFFQLTPQTPTAAKAIGKIPPLSPAVFAPTVVTKEDLTSIPPEALKVLSKSKVAVYALHYKEKLTIPEIAKRRGIQVSTVEVYLREALMQNLPMNYEILGVTDELLAQVVANMESLGTRNVFQIHSSLSPSPPLSTVHFAVARLLIEKQSSAPRVVAAPTDEDIFVD